MKNLFLFGVLSILALTFSGCEKVEGPGGSSSIVGKLYALERDGFGNVIVEYDLADEDVFIIYGAEGTTHNDDVKTSYDGSFRFDYLEAGTYQVFVYEKCLVGECPSGERALLTTIEITEKKSTIDMGTINVYK